MLVKKIILVLDSPWGKCKLMLFEHIKGHSSSEDKKSVKKLQSLWTHPAFLKSSAPLAQAIFKWRRKIQLMSAGLRLQRVFFCGFGVFAFLNTQLTQKHTRDASICSAEQMFLLDWTAETLLAFTSTIIMSTTSTCLTITSSFNILPCSEIQLSFQRPF